MSPNPIPADPASTPATFKDRRTGLIVFGILTVCLGGLCALVVPLMLFGQAMARTAAGGTAAGGTPSMLPIMASYGGLAVVLVWLGIGSLLTRRWARALILIFGWSFLVVGVISMIAVGLLLPGFLRSGQPGGTSTLPAGAETTVMVIILLFLGFLFVLIPGIWVAFYGNRNVKATCEARNPAPSWTDACPLPLLAVSLWLGFSALGMPMSFLSYRAVLPVFGILLTGPWAVLTSIGLTLVWGLGAWWLYRREARGWWLVVGAFLIFGISNFITYSRLDPIVIYEQMGFPATQIDAMKGTPWMSGDTIRWLTTAVLVPILAYMVAIRRYLRAERDGIPF
ncbi:MAG: hypothetical protein U1G08_02015 [Verrucomicrobiota bacterium]